MVSKSVNDGKRKEADSSAQVAKIPRNGEVRARLASPYVDLINNVL